jgi:hypothetical protein
MIFFHKTDTEKELASLKERNKKLEYLWAEAAVQHNQDFDRIVKLSRQVIALREALEFLMDMQNGPPLITWEKDWKAAMEQARKALALPTPTPPNPALAYDPNLPNPAR